MNEEKVYIALMTKDNGCPNVCVKAESLKGKEIDRAWIDEDGELYIVTKKKELQG